MARGCRVAGTLIPGLMVFVWKHAERGARKPESHVRWNSFSFRERFGFEMGAWTHRKTYSGLHSSWNGLSKSCNVVLRSTYCIRHHDAWRHFCPRDPAVRRRLASITASSAPGAPHNPTGTVGVVRRGAHKSGTQESGDLWAWPSKQAVGGAHGACPLHLHAGRRAEPTNFPATQSDGVPCFFCSPGIPGFVSHTRP